MRDLPSFVAEVTRLVRAELLESGDRGRTWAVDDVRSEERQDGKWDLGIVFRDGARPDCTFGFRFDDLGKWQTLVPAPGPLANICIANLEESIEAGDSGFADVDCNPNEIVWIA